MNPGDIVLVPLPQVGGGTPKLRPALFLVDLPGPYQTMLLCGISTQLHTLIPNWDELIHPGDGDFPTSGLHKASVIRLSYLAGAEPGEVTGLIGGIAAARLVRLRSRLADRARP
jgi:mRNA interferase MazF